MARTKLLALFSAVILGQAVFCVNPVPASADELDELLTYLVDAQQEEQQQLREKEEHKKALEALRKSAEPNNDDLAQLPSTQPNKSKRRFVPLD